MVAKALPRSRTFTPDRANAKIDQSRDSLAQALSLVPFLTGKLVEDVSVSAAVTLVTHGLGRKMRGFIVTKSTSDGAELPAYVSAGPDATMQVYMKVAITTFAGDLWFF